MSKENINGKKYSAAECLLAISDASTRKLAVEKYCPALDQWTLFAEFEEDSGVNFCCAMMDEQLIVIGGLICAQPLNKATSFNLNTMKSTALKRPATYRHGACATVLEGFLYYIGGADERNQYLNTVERWDRNNDAWSFVKSMNEKRFQCAVRVLNGRIYVSGGFNETSLSIKSMENYDPNENKWTFCAPMNVARSGLELGVLNNCLYAVGGYSAANLNSVERYDPNTDSWTTLCSLPTSRDRVGCAAVAGHLLVVGGFGHPGGICSENYDNIVEEYDPEANTWITKTPKAVSGSCTCVLWNMLTTDTDDSHSQNLQNSMSK